MDQENLVFISLFKGENIIYVDSADTAEYL